MGAIVSGIVGFLVGAGVVVGIALCAAADDQDPLEDIEQMEYLRKWREGRTGREDDPK